MVAMSCAPFEERSYFIGCTLILMKTIRIVYILFSTHNYLIKLKLST